MRQGRIGLSGVLSVGAAALGLLGGAGAALAQEGDGAPERRSVLLVLTNHGELGATGKATGFYLPEAAHPWHVFHEAGWGVALASPKGGAAPVDPRSMDLEDEWNKAFAARFVRDGVVPATVALSAIDAREFDAVFFAGGHGTMWDFPTEDVARVGETVYGAGGVVAAVCHGPAALVRMRTPEGEPVVKGRRVTGFTNAEEEAVELTEAMPFLLETRLRELGASFEGAPDFEANVVVDGRVVTGQNPASAEGAARAVVEAVEGESADE